jgi:hypothetical protein
VELRAVPDCPNLDATRSLLRACLSEAGLPVAVVERIGDYPSPSVLIDGKDVTGADPDGPAACVLRPPTADQIRAALRAAVGAKRDPAVDGQTTVDPGLAEFCPPGGAIRADRPQRAAGLLPAVRGLHRQLLRHFASTGSSPTPHDLAEVAAADGVEVHQAMRRLAEEDLVALDNRGRLLAAYPFSPAPTAHVVRIGGVRTYAMCAIDALGVPAMVGRDATITSTDTHTGRPIVVTVVAGRAAFDPHETVAARQGHDHHRYVIGQRLSPYGGGPAGDAPRHPIGGGDRLT